MSEHVLMTEGIPLFSSHWEAGEGFVLVVNRNTKFKSALPERIEARLTRLLAPSPKVP